MATTIRIELYPPGVRHAALTSPEVRAMLKAKVDAVAAAARSNTTLEVVASVGGKARARGEVRLVGAAGAATEAKHRVLGTAIDAARSS